MEEYKENRPALGWPIDPRDRKVNIYGPETEVHCFSWAGSI